MSHVPETLCVVLAGGLGRRLGGVDKASVEIAGIPLIDRVLQRIGSGCRAVIVNANGDAARFARLALPVVPDGLAGAQGPLAGLLTAMDWAVEHHPACTHILSVPADAPFLPADLLDCLAGAVGEEAGIAVAASGGRLHPVIALWPIALRNDLRRAVVDEGVRRVGAWMDRYVVVAVEWPTEPIDPFFNVNRPEDVAEAQRLLER